MNLIFDIGYNRGDFSREALKSYPDCKIIGVEANSALVATHRPSESITLLNKAVSNIGGETVPFYVSSEDGISTASTEFLENSRFAKGSKYINHRSQWSPPIPVASVTLDELIDEYGAPDFIKIDVEGYEKQVIEGLSRRVPLLAFEWHEEDFDSVKEIVNHLLGLGFEEFAVVGYIEGEPPDQVTFSNKGDGYLDFPRGFYSWDELQKPLEQVIDPSRRVHYGMFYAK
jgi:FkbM family methyltransferase